MKKLALALALLLTLTLSASAQTPSAPFSLYGGLGLTLPQSPDGWKDNYKTGYHFMAGIGFKVNPMLQVIGKAEYNTHKSEFGDLPGISGGDQKNLMFGVDGRLGFDMPAAPIVPFFIAGIGLAHLSWSDFEGSVPEEVGEFIASAMPDSETKFYFNVGGGVTLKSGPGFSLFLQGRYLSIATEGDSQASIPITVGVKFF